MSRPLPLPPLQISDATIVDMVRGLFLYMWRAINKGVPRAVASTGRGGTTYLGDLLAGAPVCAR